MQSGNPPEHAQDLYIGLMSGTSMDGVDGVLVAFPQLGAILAPQVLAAASLPFGSGLRYAFMALQAQGINEIHREALAGNALARLYADCVKALLEQAGLPAQAVRAIGAHGQTIRHQPGLYDGTGYTRQTLNAALLAELSGIDVVADLRSRDIAAGGQGAPLVPAFHRALFSHAGECRVICNIGGIANLSILPAEGALPVLGFDSGPGNALMDFWINQHQSVAYDAGGAWAASGQVDAALLDALLAEPYFAQQPPKSTGRDLFNPDWLLGHLQKYPGLAPQDVQATLTELTARTIADALRQHAPNASRLFICGGGAHNARLMQRLQTLLAPLAVAATDTAGAPAQQVEALAFAWLAERFCLRLPGNLPSATGAHGPRVLGALYPA